MTVTLVTVIIVCICYCVYAEDNHESSGTPDDIVECVFTIGSNSSITVNKKEQNNSTPYSIQRQYLQNIGYIDVMVTEKFSVTVKPCHSRTFISPVTVHNVDKFSRAIIYASECEESGSHDESYDKNNDLKETFNLGVKFISTEHLNIDKLISHFWPQNKPNVWQQIYDKVNHLLDEEVRVETSRFINTTMEDIKEALVTLTKNITDFESNYLKIGEMFLHNVSTFTVLSENNDITDLYISPLYSNYVTLNIYYFLIGYQNGFEYFRNWIKNIIIELWEYIIEMEKTPIESLYQTVYAGALYNVMMNARSYYAVHVLEMVSVWESIYKSVNCDYIFPIKNVPPLSYSKLYGKATPNLLQQAIHIEQSALVAKNNNGYLMKLNKILFYIEIQEQLETVYGLKLEFSSNSIKTMGTTKAALNIQMMTLDLENRTIIELKVYKTSYIRCLQFILSKGEEVTIGNNCCDNSVNFTFKFEGHYIHSLYLANDYLDTKEYFDNVVVSYLPLNN